MSKVLTISNLSKIYYSLNGETLALKDLNLSINNGEFVCIVGSSGCGKSTLLSILAGLDKKYLGNIDWNVDKPVIGYMFQKDTLFPWLTVKENAMLGQKIKRIENESFVNKLLKEYYLDSFKDKKPNELSGGMKQRVSLIRTLAVNPDILLLDEPFSALDYQTRLSVSEDVYNIIKKEQKTTIMITHDIGESIALADRIVILSKRPGHVKKEYVLDFDKYLTPTERRNTEKFRNYYSTIWKDLDHNE